MKNNNIPVYFFFLKGRHKHVYHPASLLADQRRATKTPAALLSSCSWRNNTEKTRCHILQGHRDVWLFLSQTQRWTPVPRQPQRLSTRMDAWDHSNHAPLQNPWAKAARSGVQWHTGIVCRRAKGCRAALPKVLRLPSTQRISTFKGRASPALMLYIQLHFFAVTPLIATLKHWQHYLKV